MEDTLRHMKDAIRQAKKALALGETPIGCVIVYDGPADNQPDKVTPAPKRGSVIARGYNRRNTDHSTLSHAEMTAIKKASRVLGDWRLEDCTLYVTLEPCQMCAGAIVQARIPRVVIGAMNQKAGCAGSVYNLLEDDRFNHQAHVLRGVMKEECADLLKSFFTSLRLRNKSQDSH